MKTKDKTRLFSLIMAVFLGLGTVSAQILIEKNSNWSYLDDGSDQGTEWKENSFDYSHWDTGHGVLGYEIDDYATTILSYGDDVDNKYITYYFRSTFNYTPDPENDYAYMTLNVDDGAVVYINAVEVLRLRMPSGPITYTTTASANGSSGKPERDATVPIPFSSLVPGLNYIAVEVHQRSPTSSDIAFDTELAVGKKPVFDVGQIRFGSIENAHNGVTITWRSSGEADSIRWGYTSEFEMGSNPAEKRISTFVNNFDYTFPELTPGETIHYSIYYSHADEWKEEMTYQVAGDASDNAFSFTVLGDSRTNMDQWGLISEAAEQTDFTLFMGDIVDDGQVLEQWDDWLSEGEDFIANQIIFHSIGNHDEDNSASGYDNFRNLFSLPNNEQYYAFTHGNAVFICLNSEEESSSTQYSWLKSTLETHKDKEWKIVFFHRPFYTSPSHEGEMDGVFNTWWKTFDEYGVDMIFNGHTHNYQRTKPINREVSTTSPVANYGSESGYGRCQIVTGAAGAPFSGNPDPSWWLEKGRSGVLHYCKVDIDEKVLSFQAIGNTKVVIDEFTINKTYSSVNNQKMGSLFNVYPNPSNDLLYVHSLLSGIYSIKIYDLVGSLVFQKEAFGNTALETIHKIDISGQASGMYLLEIETPEGNMSQKIMIQ